MERQNTAAIDYQFPAKMYSPVVVVVYGHGLCLVLY